MSERPAHLADEMEAIRHLLSTYAVNGDRLRLKALAETFAPDGVLETPTVRYSGRAAIEAGLGSGRHPGAGPSASRAHSFSRHNLTTSNIALTDADHAAGRTYFVVYTDAGLDHLGFYDDDLVKLDGAWRFQRRRVRIDWVSESSVMPALLAAHRQRVGAQ